MNAVTLLGEQWQNLGACYLNIIYVYSVFDFQLQTSEECTKSSATTRAKKIMLPFKTAECLLLILLYTVCTYEVPKSQYLCVNIS